MATNKVIISGVKTSELKVLTTEEMTELFKKMQSGDPFARNDLVNGNLKLVLSILRKVPHWFLQTKQIIFRNYVT